MTRDQAICFLEEYHKNLIVIEDRNGEKYNFSIKSFIPMMRKDRDPVVYDLEILLEKRKNKYFSVKLFLEEKSWVKSVVIMTSKDKRIKKRKLVSSYVDERMADKDYVEAVGLFKEFLNKAERKWIPPKGEKQWQ